MSITNDQLKRFLQCVADTTADGIECDECFELLPRYVEIVMVNGPVPKELLVVEVHLRQCECCREEFEVVLACLRP